MTGTFVPIIGDCGQVNIVGPDDSIANLTITSRIRTWQLAADWFLPCRSLSAGSWSSGREEGTSRWKQSVRSILVCNCSFWRRFFPVVFSEIKKQQQTNKHLSSLSPVFHLGIIQSSVLTRIHRDNRFVAAGLICHNIICNIYLLPSHYHVLCLFYYGNFRIN